MTDKTTKTDPTEQRRILSGLLALADEDTRAMFHRSVELKRMQRACPHNGGWLFVGSSHMSCCGCGLVSTREEYLALVRWPEVPLEPPEALGTLLAAWEQCR
jgi:hypothetical protein